MQRAPGVSVEIVVVYFIVLELELRIDQQRYTCLEVTDDTQLYLFQRLDSGSSVDVQVDVDGLVTDQADIFKRER